MSNRTDTDPCREPFTQIFMRIIAAKKGISECYNRPELILTSNGKTRLDEALKTLPPLNVTAGALYLAVRNIVENAIKYTPKIDTPRLEVGWSRDRDKVTFVLRDYGIGIPERERRYVFREGFRGYDASRFQLRGNGLGLAVSRSVLMEAKGTLEYDAPEDGNGSIFTITVPVA